MYAIPTSQIQLFHMRILLLNTPAPVDHATDKRASAEEEAGLPEGWIEKFDPKRNKPYYVNAELRETQSN